MSQVPFVDPFISYAPDVGKPAEPKEYSLLDVRFVVPGGWRGSGRCRRAPPRSPTSVARPTSRRAGAWTSPSTSATRATTSPINATAWVSHDDSESWQPLGMEPDPPLIGDEEEDPKQRTFTTRVLPGKDPARYFVVVQDSVYNLTFSGVASERR